MCFENACFLCKIQNMKHQLATQDYIKTIAMVVVNANQEIVKVKHIANQLDVTIAAVSDMVKKLVKDGLVVSHSYKGVELTPAGLKLGLQLIRYHRLWEVFLHETLEVPWDEVHHEAEHLEHAASNKLMDRIDAYLGHPKVDPHGNPIPSVTGELLFNASEIPLINGVINDIYYVTRFEGLDSVYLTYLADNGFAIGSSIELLQYFEFDGSVLCNINGRQLQLSKAIAGQIFISRSKD